MRNLEKKEHVPWNPIRGTTCLAAWGIDPVDFDWTPLSSENGQSSHSQERIGALSENELHPANLLRR